MKVKKFILLFVFLSACMPQVETTIAPSPTPEIINTVTPLPTATLSEVDKIFVIPTKDSSFVFDSTPMPISTPITASTILLRNLSENDYINWIRELQTYSYKNYPPYGDWWSEGMFISSQLPLALVIQEFLYLYPNSVHAERLKWQLAFIDSLVFRYITIVGGNVYDDKWVINELEKGINQGKFLPDEMEVFLDLYWFDVDYYQPVENLFGDNEVSWFYVISPQVWGHEEEFRKSPDHFRYGGMFLVIRKIDNDKFKIYLLENAWSFVNGSSSLFEISDFNQNGITEIALSIGYHGGGICSGHMSIYEWEEDEFNDLTNGEIEIRDCGDFYEYSVVSGTPIIEFTKFFEPGLSIYTWNGSYYEFSGYRYSTLVEKWWATDNFSEEVFAIEEILASEDFSGLDNAHVDFLRFRLGILYALESNEVQSKIILQSLGDNPFDKTRTVYSNFARAFLKYYSGDETLYLACKKSREIFDASIPHVFSQEAEEKFGIPFTFSNAFNLNLLKCSDKDVMDTLIKNTSPLVENIPVWLGGNGMQLHYYEHQDIDLDGFLMSG